jgi:hypothetical protein
MPHCLFRCEVLDEWLHGSSAMWDDELGCERLHPLGEKGTKKAAKRKEAEGSDHFLRISFRILVR